MLLELYIEVGATELALLRIVAMPPTIISSFGVRVPDGTVAGLSLGG
jgi:hypothetical protein